MRFYNLGGLYKMLLTGATQTKRLTNIFVSISKADVKLAEITRDNI